VQRICAIALIPQGINNSTQPRRKLWIHCNGTAETILQGYITIRAYTLDTTLNTQAITRMENGQINLEIISGNSITKDKLGIAAAIPFSSIPIFIDFK